VTYNNYFGGSTDNSLDTQLINTALGIKLASASGSVMRIELNYKYYTNSSSYSYSDQYNKTTIESESGIDALSIAIGYSILF